MARKSAPAQIAAIAFSGQALYFIRPMGEEGVRLPMLFHSGLGQKRALVRYMRKEFGVEAFIVRKLPQIVVSGQPSSLVDPYLVELQLPEGENELPFVALEEGDPGLEGTDPVSAGVAKRAFIFMPFYTQWMRTVPLLEADQEKVYWELECLKHFQGRKVPRAEVHEFEGLIQSASSLRRINEAFAMICNRYQANPNEYIRYLKYRQKRREDLK
ncbi:MAG: hypothetical protein K6E59_06225 [Bacilli bacterium]|nr:hypothetical protein [Bacilli bacterium]